MKDFKKLGDEQRGIPDDIKKVVNDNWNELLETTATDGTQVNTKEMNYTEIAKKFNQEHGRAMTWDECVLYVNKVEGYFTTYLMHKDSARLYAESVRLEERRKVEELLFGKFNKLLAEIKDLASLKSAIHNRDRKRRC